MPRAFVGHQMAARFSLSMVRGDAIQWDHRYARSRDTVYPVSNKVYPGLVCGMKWHEMSTSRQYTGLYDSQQAV